MPAEEGGDRRGIGPLVGVAFSLAWELGTTRGIGILCLESFACSAVGHANELGPLGPIK